VGQFPITVYQALVNPNEDRAIFNTTVFTAFFDALVIRDKSYSYYVLLLAPGTIHDSDLCDIVISSDQQSGFSGKWMRN
jgi:hypothetical protein